jgi:mannosyltransferase OCH1-like enzyme
VSVLANHLELLVLRQSRCGNDHLRLQKFGGIYLDIDTIILKSFRDASLMMQDTVLAMEAKHLSIAHGRESDHEMTPKGLCNAIIVARPQSTFVKRWLDSYEEFDHNQWADHSVVSQSAEYSVARCTDSSLFSAHTLDFGSVVSDDGYCAI